jgi:DNA-binding NarL/FixJ family response regulator
MTMTPESARDTTVLILDVRSLRRAGLVSFLEAWAQSCGLTLKSSNLDEDSSIENCKMIMLSVGNSTLGDPGLIQKINAIRMQQPEAVLVTISDREDPDEMLRAFQIGIRGFIPTNLEPAVALQALTFLLSGGSFFPPAVLQSFLQHVDITVHDARLSCERDDASEFRPSHGLTMRQQEVLSFLRRGISNKLIARELNMTEATVKVHVRQIMRKLGAANRTQVAVIVATDTSKAKDLELN